jgi:N-acetylglutamate synthase-like GNAT family acetyltransferase
MARRAPPLTAIPLAIWERDGLAAALRKSALPADDVTAAEPLFWRFEADVPVGFGGLEVHAADALLRSVVTLPPLRNRGYGSAIVVALEAEAMLLKCRSVWLLTTSAARLFERLGYATCDRAAVPEAIRATPQFAALCPASATAMVKRLA